LKNKLDKQCSIRPGQQITLVVPKKAPTTLPPTTQDAPETTARPAPRPQPKVVAPEGMIVHRVAEGQSLWVIASHYDDRSAEILKRNKLESDMVRPGQQLIIKPGSEYGGKSLKQYAPKKQPKKSTPKPAPKKTEKTEKPATAGKCNKKITHTVQPCESLWSIAKFYDAYSSQIRETNGVQSDTLRVGQKLTICTGSEYRGGVKPKTSCGEPSSSTSSSPSSSSTASCPKKGKKVVYTVKQGDVLGQIAIDHGVKTACIRDWNGIQGDSIRVGQKLVIYK
jgi:D-gamma-glutamyl-meso-diaminopimelic acid endopeptidase CwlS